MNAPEWIGYGIVTVIAVVAVWLAAEANADVIALRYEVDRLRGEVMAPEMAAKGPQRLQEPRTAPIPLPVPGRAQSGTGGHDTAPIADAWDTAHRELTQRVQTVGRHRA